jgi:hypothetical protein
VAVGVKLMLLRRCECSAVVLAAVTIVNIPGPIMGSFDVACWLWRLPGCCYKNASGCCDCGSERKLLCDMAVMTAVLL